jgi:hypothetical protein
MSLSAATLITGLLLFSLGALFLVSNSAIRSMLKAFPRSQTATVIFFGGGAAWFLYQVGNMSSADLIGFSTPTPFVFIFGALAVMSFFFVPEFLAVRGVSIIILVGSWPLLMSGFMDFSTAKIIFAVAIYILVTLALYLAVSPFRMRDFLEWLYRTPGRARVFGGVLATYGLVLTCLAFSH